MYVRVRSSPGLGNVGSPWITTSIREPVRHFECLPAPRAGYRPGLRKYVRQAARGAAKTGSKLVVEEGLRKMGLDSKEAIEAVWATVERVARETP